MLYKILIVEDEPGFSQPLSELLTSSGFEVQVVKTLAEFKRVASIRSTDLLILDRSLPDGDGLSLLTEIRQVSELPIIVLTGLGAQVERIRGLNADVDHYLVKPVDIEEVLALVQRHERKMRQNHARNGAWALNTRTWSLISPEGRLAKLTHREALLMSKFAGIPGEPVYRDALVEAMGFMPAVYDFRRLESTLSRLRKKLDETGFEKFPLENIYGGKYAFNALLNLHDRPEVS